MSEHASLLIRASTSFAAIVSRNNQLRTSVPVVLAATAAAIPSTASCDIDDSKGNSNSKSSSSTSTSSTKDTKQKFQVVNEESKELKQLETKSRSVLRGVAEQMSFGGTLGFATGYAIRTLTKPILFFVGTEVLIIQYMVYRNWMTVHWNRLAHDLSPKFSGSTTDGLLDILVYKMPFSASFTGGVFAGLKLSATK